MVDRHADTITMDHIIELRKEILKLEKRVELQDRYIENATACAVSLRNENLELRKQIHDLTRPTDSEV
jgi:hypothetical protein